MAHQQYLSRFAFEQLTEDKVQQATQQLIDQIREHFNAMDKLPLQDLVPALMRIDFLYVNQSSVLSFPKECCTDRAVRWASIEASKRISAFWMEMCMRKDVFDKLCAFKATDKWQQHLSPEVKRYVQKKVQEGLRNGLHLDQETRDKVQALNIRISQLGTDFMANVNNDQTVLEVSEEQLRGVPEQLISSVDRTKEGLCRLSMKCPHYLQVMKTCRLADTRKAMDTAYLSRCKEQNMPILKELLKLKHEKALLLGYSDHAAFIHEERMAKNPETVSTFLRELLAKFEPYWAQEKQKLLDLKQAECHQMGIPFSGQLDSWDLRYYCNMVEVQDFSVDKQALKDYFPLTTVLSGLLKIYQQLLGLTFIELGDAPKWHPDVRVIQVLDTAQGHSMGYFFLDLHPREGKYAQAAVFHLLPGCLDPDGQPQLPVCAMLANFSQASHSKPALLHHKEVETFFHEFGHVMHFICAQTETAYFSVCKMERDFVEAPSQMLENWVWQEEPIHLMSGHYMDGSKIPQDQLDKLLASRLANVASCNLRQLIFALFDLQIHMGPCEDPNQVYAQIYEQVLGLPTIRWSACAASAYHLISYSAQYYGYLWSEVFSQDMFQTHFQNKGLFDPKIGMDYRLKVLKPGGSRDANDLIRAFLGREPNQDAFLRSKGLLK